MDVRNFKMPGKLTRIGKMHFQNARDESLLHFYESVRRQMEADRQSGGRYRVVGESARQYADKLREEMDKRRLRYTAIDWSR
jgi:hypothetical protein